MDKVKRIIWACVTHLAAGLAGAGLALKLTGWLDWPWGVAVGFGAGFALPWLFGRRRR